MRCNRACPLYPRKRPQKRTPANGHVRFTSQSGHVRCTRPRPLSANSGLKRVDCAVIATADILALKHIDRTANTDIEGEQQ